MSPMSNYEEDSVRQYLNEMSQYPLLSAEEERRLATQVQTGRNASEQRLALATELDPVFSNAELYELSWTTQGYPDDELRTSFYESSQELALTIEQEREYALAIEIGKSATQLMINSNLRYVVSIAKTFQGKGLPLLDLIQYGNLGLDTGVKGFNPDFGYRLTTYATRGIRQEIIRGIAEVGDSMRLPRHAYEERKAIQAQSASFFEDNGRYPSDSELADALDWSLIKTKQRLDYFRGVKALSLNEPVGNEDGDTELGDLIPFEDPSFDNLEILDEAEMLRQIIDNRDCLSEREANVIKMRFFKGMTFESIGISIGLTREAIRQIEIRSLRKLRREAYESELAYNHSTISPEDY